MTDTTIAILDPSVALATDAGWDDQVAQWKSILQENVLPKSTNTPAKCIAITKLGQERFGWGPMDSVTKLQIVEGKIELTAEACMGLMLERATKTEGEYIMPVERSMDRAAIEVKRAGWPKGFVFEFTQEDAEHAGLWGKKSSTGRKMPWSQYEKDMMWARCVSRVSRGAMSDVTGGAYTFGEISGGNDSFVSVTQLANDTSLASVLVEPEPVEEPGDNDPADDQAEYEALRKELQTLTEQVSERYGLDMGQAAGKVVRDSGVALGGPPDIEQTRALIKTAMILMAAVSNAPVSNAP